MKAIRVQYTVSPAYVETNKANIREVMSALRSLGNTDVRYSAFVGEDGQTFTHMVMFRDEQTPNPMPDLPAFQKFQAELKASNPEVPPASENLSFVDAGFEVFD